MLTHKITCIIALCPSRRHRHAAALYGCAVAPSSQHQSERPYKAWNSSSVLQNVVTCWYAQGSHLNQHLPIFYCDIFLLRQLANTIKAACLRISGVLQLTPSAQPSSTTSPLTTTIRQLDYLPLPHCSSWPFKHVQQSLCCSPSQGEFCHLPLQPFHLPLPAKALLCQSPPASPGAFL